MKKTFWIKTLAGFCTIWSVAWIFGNKPANWFWEAVTISIIFLFMGLLLKNNN